MSQPEYRRDENGDRQVADFELFNATDPCGSMRLYANGNERCAIVVEDVKSETEAVAVAHEFIRQLADNLPTDPGESCHVLADEALESDLTAALGEENFNALDVRDDDGKIRGVLIQLIGPLVEFETFHSAASIAEGLRETANRLNAAASMLAGTVKPVGLSVGGNGYTVVNPHFVGWDEEVDFTVMNASDDDHAIEKVRRCLAALGVVAAPVCVGSDDESATADAEAA